MSTSDALRDETVSSRLEAMGLELPSAPRPIATFAPWVKDGHLIYVSGQLATDGGDLVASGLIGTDLDVTAGQRAARACALNVLAQLSTAAGGVDNIERILKLTVFVACAPGFGDQPLVANGASELIVDLFGEHGPHARSAVGVSALPLGSPVEIEAIALLRSA